LVFLFFTRLLYAKNGSFAVMGHHDEGDLRWELASVPCLPSFGPMNYMLF